MSELEPGRIPLVALFVTSLVTGQILAAKILIIPSPVPIPGTGDILVPAGVVAYALTFFATDCTTELYGREPAEHLVRTGFLLLLFVMLPLIAVAVVAPGSPAGVPPEQFNTVLAFSPNVIIGGLTAYVISQHWDIFAFHRIREWTGAEKLWLRNVGSTATSQAIDTVVFITMAFLVLPSVLPGSQPLPLPVVGGLIIGQYLLKLVIALVDTPLVYLAVGYVRTRWELPETGPAA